MTPDQWALQPLNSAHPQRSALPIQIQRATDAPRQNPLSRTPKAAARRQATPSTDSLRPCNTTTPRSG
jgi:hypothetical protein